MTPRGPLPPFLLTRRRLMQGLAGLGAGAALESRGLALADEDPDEIVTTHGISIFGTLKYPADFKHFDYVNPDAPKGGIHRTWSLGSFDSLTPFTEKGDAADGAWGVFDSLMTGTLDTLDEMYPLIATSATYPKSKRWVSFKMNEAARFADGSPLTAEDVLFTFDAMKTKGQLRYRAYFDPIALVEALGPHEVKFTFAEDAPLRDMLSTVAGTSIFSKAYFDGRDFSRASLDPPLGSGAYQVERVEAGRTVVYKRNESYWAKDLPSNIGTDNFDRMRIDYYTDQSSAFEAFKAGEYSYRTESNADRWITGYTFPARTRGDVVLTETPAHTVPYAGGVFFNLRRAPFDDVRIREAIQTMFNFEWTNTTLFHGVEQRSVSYWDRSPMVAVGPTPEDERAVLEPLMDKLPPETADILTAPAALPFQGTGETETDRARRRRATELFAAAGYKPQSGKLIGPDGKQLRFEIMYGNPDAEQYLAPFAKALIGLGVDATLRLVDSAQWRERAESFDFDSFLVYVPTSDTPGNELRDTFGSKYAKVGGSLNVSGVASPGIDALIALIENADSRDILNVRVRALDRVLRAMRLRVPLWFRPDAWAAFYDFYRHPDALPPYGTGAPATWWADSARYDALRAAGTLR